MTILFLDRSRLFGHFLLKVVVEVFQSIRHAIEALSNAPDFVFASRRHARRQISAGESVDAFAEFIDGTNHPAPEEKHNRKETADRQHNQEHLQIAKLPQIPASPLFNAVRKIRCFIQKTAECILVNRLPKRYCRASALQGGRACRQYRALAAAGAASSCRRCERS